MEGLRFPIATNEWQLFARVFVAVWVILGVISASHAVMYKREPKGAAVWLFVSFTIPIVGPWLYWVIGINRLERRAMRRRRKQEPHAALPDHAAAVPLTKADLTAVGHLNSLHMMADRVTRMPLVPGNRIEPLHNGEGAYPTMLQAIAEAKETVTLTSYIFDWDEVGRAFADALGEAAARGVRVHVLLDGVGAVRSFSRTGRRLIKSGAEVAAFFPLRIPLGRLRINLRNHRKLLIVDGRIGFTGGMNISQRHLLEGEPPRVEDLHFRVTGPIVGEMQQAFVEDWLLATGESLVGVGYFPSLGPEGPALCRGIISGPDEDFEKIHWLLQAAFAAAQRSVRIATPYFIPTSVLIGAMNMAALRGVEITLVLPSKLDLPYMRWAADAYLWQLLEHGVRIYRRGDHFVHTKLLVVDDRWILLGSANLDPRSFRLNFEFNIEAYDVELAMGLCQWIDGLLPACERVTLEAMDARPPFQRLRDGIVKMFSPHL